MEKNSIDHIKFNRIRPRVRFSSNQTPDQFTRSILENLAEPEKKIEGIAIPNFVTIYPSKEERYFWSPQLTLIIEEIPCGSYIRGLYGPKPSVWTMFMFFYSIVGFVTLIATLVSLSYWSLGEESIIFWSIPALLILLLTLFLVAYIGQKIGHKQIAHVHKFLEDTIGEKIKTV